MILIVVNGHVVQIIINGKSNMLIYSVLSVKLHSDFLIIQGRTNFFVHHTIAEVYRPNDVRMAMDLHYYYGDCTTPETQAQIKQNFILLLNESFFNQVCQDPALKDKCNAKNVDVTCSSVVSVTSRRRRSVGKQSSINLSIKRREAFTVFPSSYKKDKLKEG